MNNGRCSPCHDIGIREDNKNCRYPHWFSRESVQIHFAADLICSIVLGSDVGIKQCDAIIRYGQTLLRWDHDALTQIIRRVAARTRDANVFKRLLMAWRYEPPPY